MIARNDDCLTKFLTEVYFPLKMPSVGTQDDYAAVIRTFAGWLGDKLGEVSFSGITPEVIGRYLIWLQTSGKCGTNRSAGHGRVLRAVLKVALKRRLLEIDIDEIPRPREFKKHPLAWSQEQAEKIIAAARSMRGYVGPWPVHNWLPALIFTSVSTDWRITAIMRLRVADTSLTERFAISTESKQHKQRCAKLTPQCVEALRSIWGPREEVFGDWPCDRGDRQWKTLNGMLGEAIRIAGVPDIGRWHAFRKTATTMVADKLGRDAAARFAGHGDRRTTDAHYIDDSKLTGPTAADVLPRFKDGGADRQRRLFD